MSGAIMDKVWGLFGMDSAAADEEEEDVYDLVDEEEQEEYDFVTYRKVLWIKCIDNKINTNDLDLDEEKKLLNTIMIECINNTLSSAKENHLKKIQQELNSIAFGTIKAGQTKEYRTSHDLYDELYDEANQILINRFICSE